MINVGINGFGRIGRLILRAILENYKDYKNIFQNKYSQIVKNIIENRNSFSMQNQIHRIIDFYKKTSLEFNKNS